MPLYVFSRMVGMARMRSSGRKEYPSDTGNRSADVPVRSGYRGESGFENASATFHANRLRARTPAIRVAPLHAARTLQRLQVNTYLHPTFNPLPTPILGL